MVDIYGTIGPSCADEAVLVDMFKAGMTGIRLNLSHTCLKDAGAQIDMIHSAASKCGIKAKLLIDMQGPELRIGKLEAPVELVQDKYVFLCKSNDSKAIPQQGSENEEAAKLTENATLCRVVVPEIVVSYLREGHKVLLDDGKLLLEVVSRLDDGAIAKVIRGGILQSGKSIAIPGSDIYPPTMTAQDMENISIAGQYGVTGVMQPFVRNAEDLKIVRRALDEAGWKDICLLAKIENMSGVEHLEEFFPLADEIVIARGDLGNAMPLWELPGVQKKIASMCNEKDMSFMVVTQMLASMEKNPVPTRAEVSDIYNAILDGASSVMVTGETAVGYYPVEVIKYLANTVLSALN